MFSDGGSHLGVVHVQKDLRLLHARQAGLPQRLLDAQLRHHLPDFFVPLAHTVYHLQLLLVQNLKLGIEAISDGVNEILDSDRGEKIIIFLTIFQGLHFFV